VNTGGCATGLYMRPQSVSKLLTQLHLLRRVALNVRWLSWQHIRGKATRISIDRSMHYEGGLRARPIGVMSDALTTGLTGDELLSGRLKFQRKSLFMDTSYGYPLVGSPLIGRLNGCKGGFN
jgi:hypothetical protein